jgi:hypothetical protein
MADERDREGCGHADDHDRQRQDDASTRGGEAGEHPPTVPAVASRATVWWTARVAAGEGAC